LRFVTDGMLGKLTRWLRMLGHDVKYSRSLDDKELIKTTKRARRVLLTRDLELYRQAVARGAEAVLVEGASESEKLAKLAKKFDFKLEIDPYVSRCPKCNVRVKAVSKEEIVSNVPKATFSNYEEFWECPKCGQIYWQGAHWKRIGRTLKEAKQALKLQ